MGLSSWVYGTGVGLPWNRYGAAIGDHEIYRHPMALSWQLHGTVMEPTAN